MVEMKSIEDENNKIDLLDRQPFIDQVKKLCELISKNKESRCFAINGSWGVGKTFVLDILESELKEEQQEDGAKNKYLLFRYDCWEYDYYQEPVIAMVAALIDEIDKNVNILPWDTVNKVKGLLKAVGSGLLMKANDTIVEKTGIDVEAIINIIKDGDEDAASRIEESHEYDVYFSFKKTLARLKETIAILSKEQTLVVIVDELDRCLPEYMIKVLERLHHVFEDIPNVQVILAVDKQQLEYTIKQIYGESTDVDKYLSKFIDFTVNLDTGTLNDRFEEVFKSYISHFKDIKIAADLEDVEEFRKIIFQGIDIRSSIDIINKSSLLHEIIWGEEQAEGYVMCIELFISVLMYWGVDLKHAKVGDIAYMFSYERKGSIQTGLDLFEEKCNFEEEYTGLLLIGHENDTVYIRRSSLWSLLYMCYRYVGGCEHDHIMYDKYEGCEIKKICDNYMNLMMTID